MSVRLALATGLALSLATPLWPRAAGATEGVIQIGAAAAPYTITAAGSYRLVANLTVANPNTHAIVIQAGLDGVEIDLNGFSIAGPNDCTYDTTTDAIGCTGSGTGRGIDGLSASGVIVRNGFVRGMGATGIALGGRATVENVVVADNGDYGIQLGLQAHVSGCLVTENANDAMNLGANAVVSGNVVSYAGQRGIVTGSESVVRGNVVESVGQIGGIRVVNDSIVEENVVSDALYGIYGADGVVVSRDAVVLSRVVGIRVDDESSLREVVVSNMGANSSATLSLGQSNSVNRSVFFPATGRPNVVEDASVAFTTGISDSLSLYPLFDEGPSPGGMLSLGGNCCEGAGVLESEYVIGSTACTPIPD